MSERRYFGTDGIRGRVGQGPISADFFLQLGWAAGRALRGEGRPKVVIGKDTRISGYMFEAALEAGLVASGADVYLLGPVPTPAVAYLTRSMRADAGIVISASHNPHFDNGIKFFSARGEKLSDALEEAIERAIDEPFVTVDSEQLGKARRVDDAATRYSEFCKSTVADGFSLDGVKLVVDCAHGATYAIAPPLLAELGAEVESIGVSPDGLNINRDCGSMHLQPVAERVVATGADFGIAFDGDGDRLQMVDHQGVVVDGDDLLYLLAAHWKASGRLRGPVVGTLMSNFGLEQALAALDIEFKRARVGDRFVHQRLVADSGTLGGETSGHLLCLDRATTGDALVSLLQVLEALGEQKLGLRAALGGLRKFPQQTVNVRLDSGTRPAEADSVKTALESAQARLGTRGRAFLRPSGTEPVIRVTVEADDAALMQEILQPLADAVRQAASAS